MGRVIVGYFPIRTTRTTAAEVGPLIDGEPLQAVYHPTD
jgi:hypothetical protein